MSGYLSAIEVLGEAIAAYKAHIADLERTVQMQQQIIESLRQAPETAGQHD